MLRPRISLRCLGPSCSRNPRVGRLFASRVPRARSDAYRWEMCSMLEEYHLGPSREANMLNFMLKGGLNLNIHYIHYKVKIETLF